MANEDNKHCDKLGRDWARVVETNEGDLIQVDANTSCIKAWTYLRVKSNGQDKFIDCNEGRHYLSGYLSFDGLVYIGIYHIPSNV